MILCLIVGSLPRRLRYEENGGCVTSVSVSLSQLPHVAMSGVTACDCLGSSVSPRAHKKLKIYPRGAHVRSPRAPMAEEEWFGPHAGCLVT